MKAIDLIVVLGVSLLVGSVLWASAPTGQYVDLKDGTVRDVKTGLVWQQGVSASQYVWADAKSYCNQQNQARLGGFSSGWRLPSKLELESLVDRRVASPQPAIDLALFPATPAGEFWTGTPYADDPGSAWDVDFDGGYSSYGDDAMKATFWVRCVR
jgi:hypothetical protein